MIHQYKLNGYNIVLDVHSGSVHAVDEIAYDIIEWYLDFSRDEIIRKIQEKYPQHHLSHQEIIDCMDDVEALRESGQLFTQDVYRDLACRKKSDNVIKAMCLHVSLFEFQQHTNRSDITTTYLLGYLYENRLSITRNLSSAYNRYQQVPIRRDHVYAPAITALAYFLWARYFR